MGPVAIRTPHPQRLFTVHAALYLSLAHGVGILLRIERGFLDSLAGTRMHAFIKQNEDSGAFAPESSCVTSNHSLRSSAGPR